MKHVLVCSDLSDRSRAALARAARVSADAGAALTACTMLDEDLPDATLDERRERARADLSAALAECGAGAAEIAVEVSPPVEAVGALADRLKTDLVVLGPHRHRPLRDLVGHTTMERIVGAIRRPVLLAAGPASSGYKRVLGGVEASAACAAALRTARDLAPGAEFRTFHAVEPPARGWFGGGDEAGRSTAALAEAEERISRWWTEADLPPEVPPPDYLALPLEKAFRKIRYDFAPDLVAIGAHDRPGAAPGRLGSFTEQILRWQFCDTLILRAPDETAA